VEGGHDFSKACLYEKVYPRYMRPFPDPVGGYSRSCSSPPPIDVTPSSLFVEDSPTTTPGSHSVSPSGRARCHRCVDATGHHQENETRLNVHGVPGTLRQVGDVYVFVPLKQRDMLRMIGMMSVSSPWSATFGSDDTGRRTRRILYLFRRTSPRSSSTPQSRRDPRRSPGRGDRSRASFAARELPCLRMKKC
jgi:hypothetical protein